MSSTTESIASYAARDLLALWIPPDCDLTAATAAIQLRWPAVWSGLPTNAANTAASSASHPVHFISVAAEAPPATVRSTIQFVFDVSRPLSPTTPEDFRKQRMADELENRVAGWAGAILFAGQPQSNWLSLVAAMAPSATIFVPSLQVDVSAPENLSIIELGIPLSEVIDQISALHARAREEDVLDLRDAVSIRVPHDYRVALGDNWEILTREHVSSFGSIDQGTFDAFLSGDLDWRVMAAGGSFPRGRICDGRGKHPVDPIAEVRKTVRALDSSDRNPADAVEQHLIFAESGSGCSTLLRQVALAVARDGYPVLITRPFPRSLNAEAVSNLIIQVQDLWAAARAAKGGGPGALPVCLILDCDAELQSRFSNFLRAISGDLHRKLVVVRAFRRSRDEIRDARHVLKLFARTTEGEMLALGSHLRRFCAHHRLASIPEASEWRAYYQGLGRIQYGQGRDARYVDTPPLFLVGLYPFIKERVRDERSLERYLYRKWEALGQQSHRDVVEVLSAAAWFGTAVPLESLLRIEGFQRTLIEPLSQDDARVFDFFAEWVRFGWHTRNWALHIRHPAFARLLMRMIAPEEANPPFSALCRLLETLTGTEADRWFADQVAYRLGRYFDSEGHFFSLEHDTGPQRAAREIFRALPAAIKDASRVVCHHNARFYIHLLHACVHAIEHPDSTQFSAEIVGDQALRALEAATAILEKARKIDDPRDKTSYLLTTLSAALARLARAMAESGDNDGAEEHFDRSIAKAEEAIADDIANGHALFTFVNAAQWRLRLFGDDDPASILETFEAAEDRLLTLTRLFDSRLWRNTSEDEAAIQLGSLVARQHEIASSLLARPSLSTFSPSTSTARAILEMRRILGTEPLAKAFRGREKATQLRALRASLEHTSGISVRGLDTLYKLYLFDPIGRLRFEERLDILGRMLRESPDSYQPYKHDHAALLCQLGQRELATTIFSEIYAAKNADPDRWVWMNERLLVERTGDDARAVVSIVRVTDAIEGWGALGATRVKIQPRQFGGELVVGAFIPAYIRFRVAGLQAVDSRMARLDMQAMGLDPNNVIVPA